MTFHTLGGAPLLFFSSIVKCHLYSVLTSFFFFCKLFRSEMVNETERLTTLSLHWESKVEDESIPEESECISLRFKCLNIFDLVFIRIIGLTREKDMIHRMSCF